MAAELVSDATNDKLTEMDWTKNIEICEIVAHDHRQARDVVKAIKKRLASKNPNAQLLAVMLLEMLMNNIGEPVHRQVMDTGILPILVKIVKKKSDLPVREKIFLLLDAAQTSVGGASGRFPQYFSAYSELVNAGLQFSQTPQVSQVIPKPQTTSNVIKNNPPDKATAAPQPDSRAVQAPPKNVSDSSILQKAGTALEVLRDVLNNVDTRRPEAAKDEFTLDLVEQCSFQKNRVMHLAITSRDEKIVSRALELNEQLEKVLRRHDDLIAGRAMSISNHIQHDQDEEEEEEQLIRRIRKGKACMRSEDEDLQTDRPLLLRRPVPPELVHRPLIRPLTLEPRQETTILPNKEPKKESARPVDVELIQEPAHGKQAVAIPPPPSKHVERERFFQENKGDNLSLNGQMGSLSLHSRNASSSCSGSIDLSD